MDKKLIVCFLAKEAIKKRGNKRDRLWDAIYKAHLDTITGARTSNINSYCDTNCGGVNKTLYFLHETINKKRKLAR